LDIYDKLRGKRHKFVPPRGHIYTGSPAGSEAYIQQSTHQLALLKKETNLKPDDIVLDIGSGIGRTAIALTEYLNSEGKYEGFDVVKKGVDWCIKKIGKEYPNFKFTYIPLFNDLYNNSTLKAENFIFPYEDAYFDVIFSFSVFTHMQIDEIQNYFKEINRVLKPNGLAFSTFFLYDNESETFISEVNDFKFPILKEGYRLMDERVKSGNIAFHKEKLSNMLQKEKLSIVKILDGFWKDKIKDSYKIEYQDIVLFKKT